MKWQVQTHGGPNERSFEISVINPTAEGFFDAQRHYGWFNENKLLISSSGGPCTTPVIPIVWNKLEVLAEQVAKELNTL